MREEERKRGRDGGEKGGERIRRIISSLATTHPLSSYSTNPHPPGRGEREGGREEGREGGRESGWEEVRVREREGEREGGEKGGERIRRITSSMATTHPLSSYSMNPHLGGVRGRERGEREGEGG